MLDSVPHLLPRLCGDGILLGITTGAVESTAQIKLVRGQLNAGAVALGVATGHFSLANLQEAGADYLVESLAKALPF